VNECGAGGPSEPWIWRGGAAALLVLLAAATRTVVVAADLRGQSRFGVERDFGAHEPMKIGEVFDLIRLHSHNHLPAAFLAKLTIS
jgi:hypothetical protein